MSGSFLAGPPREADQGGKGGFMFEIDPEAKGFIRERCNGAVTVVLDFQPMMGGG
jgi:hypothetical protein